MKKLFVTSIVFSALLLLSLAITAAPVAAYNGVTGQAVDANGDGWTHGGTVTIYEAGNSTPVGTGSLSGNGSFTIDYDPGNLPTSFSEMYILINYNAGSGGDPGSEQISYAEFPEDDYYHAGYIETGTSPTAVTLQGISATGTSSLPLLVAAGLMLLAVASFVFFRRSRVTL